MGSKKGIRYLQYDIQVDVITELVLVRDACLLREGLGGAAVAFLLQVALHQVLEYTLPCAEKGFFLPRI